MTAHATSHRISCARQDLSLGAEHLIISQCDLMLVDVPDVPTLCQMSDDLLSFQACALQTIDVSLRFGLHIPKLLWDH